MTSGFVLCILGIMFLVFVWTFRETNKAQQNEAFVIEMQQTIYERSVLRDEYLLRGEERASIQWNAKTEQMKKLLEQAGKRFTDIQEQMILDDIQKKFDASVFLFSGLVKYLHKAEDVERRLSSIETQRMLSQIIVNSYDLNSAANILRESIRKTSDAAQGRRTAVVIILMVIAVIVTVGNSLSINRILSKRIAELNEGTEIIGAGNLDHQISVNGNDELSDLARASNTMAAKLRRSYTSVANLEKEIAERKEAEEALWESEEKFSKAFHSSPAMLVLTTLDGKNLDVNQAYADFLGYSREEILGKSVVDLQIVSVEERQKILELIQRGDGSVRNAEIAVRVRDGSLRHILFSVDVISLGSVPHRLTTLLDITERKRAEEDLRIANEELLAINRIITTTTTTTGVKGILEKVLDEALHITGLEGGTICMVTPDETLNLAVHRETSEATILDLTTNQIKIGECLCGECARDHKPLILWDREAVLKFSTREAQRGEDIRFHAAFPLITGGRCVGVLCVFTRTDKKPLERRLKLLETVTSQIAIALENARLYEETIQHAAVLEDRVKERTAELSDSQGALMNLVEDLNIKSSEIEKANLRLQELDRLKSIFIASMSHELRTPLNSIIGFTGILLQGMVGELNNEQQDQLRRVQASGKHLLELINDVIDISKIEAGKVQIFVTEFSLATVIDQAVAALKGEIAHKGLDLEIALPDDVTLNTDRRRLLQCVLNLLSNAVKYTEKGAVRLSARETSGDERRETRDEKSFIEISVADTGIGIREEDLPLLFAPFTRLESPLKVKNPGTGLGLYLTKKIAVELLGGSVVAQSKPGVGSTFTLIIPKTLSGGEIK